MKYARAIDKLRTLAERCQEASRWRPDEEPFVRATYVFGEVLDGTDPLDVVQVVVAVNSDPAAPIFDFSDLAVVGDVHAIVPQLVARLRQRAGS